ncbi:hypothetical protein Tco_0879715, partial [Tanacetum coccineum]
AASGLRPYHFTYPKRKLTMKEMLYKFIDKGKREHEEMRTFICEFRTTNEILFKERNNSLRVTTRGGKTTTQDVQNNNANLHTEEPLVVNHDKPVESNEVLTNDQPQKTNEPVVQPSSEKQTSPVPFPRRLRKEKEEAQQKKFLENLKQLHINLPFIEALAQMPKYAKFLKGLLTNKARLEEACTITMNERCSAVLLNKLPSKEKDPGSFTIPCDIGQLHINNALANLGATIDNSDLGEPIRRIDSVNTPYPVARETTEPNKVESEHLYSASANEIDEKKPELKNLPHHLEYAYLYGDKSFPIIISSELSKKEKMLLLQVLEKRKGAFAWKMSNIKGISPSYFTHKILMEDDYKPVIQP